MKPTGVYGSDLNDADWAALRDILWAFLHAPNPAAVAIAPVPQHLGNHPILALLREYQQTNDDTLLDRAGQYLIPTKEPFGWYVPLTK